jgi:hypothetical protein
MFDKERYKGLVSRCYDYHTGMGIEHLYGNNIPKDNVSLSLDYGYTVKQFLYDMNYIDKFQEEFTKKEGYEISTKFMKLEREKLIIQLKEKWDKIGSDSIFNDSLGVAEIYRNELLKYIDDVSFINFSKAYYLKDGMSFSAFGKEVDMSKQPSEARYFEEMYTTHSKNSAGKQLEKSMHVDDSSFAIDVPNIKAIYFIDKEKNKISPKIYKLDVETTMFQMYFLQSSSNMLRNVYFDFDGKILIRNDNDYTDRFDVIYANPSDEYVEKGTYFMPYLGSRKRIIKVSDE